ncbi:MAG TPA: DnaB-like helicase N-terminal domain-containing protein, partial [Acidimicrobiia bacterium]
MTYTPPHDLDAEQITLAGCMERPGLAAHALEQLRPDQFYREAHRTVFETIGRLTDHEKPTDLTTVTAALTDA